MINSKYILRGEKGWTGTDIVYNAYWKTLMVKVWFRDFFQCIGIDKLHKCNDNANQ